MTSSDHRNGLSYCPRKGNSFKTGLIAYTPQKRKQQRGNNYLQIPKIWNSTIAESVLVTEIQGSPKYTFRFDNSLERTHWKLLYSKSIYYRKRIQIRISKRKRHIGLSLKEGQTQVILSSCPLPWSHGQYYLLLATMYGSLHRVLPTRKALPSFLSDFYWSFIIWHNWLITHMVELTL